MLLPLLLVVAVAGLVGLLLDGVKAAAVQVAEGDGEVGAGKGGQQDAEHAGGELLGVVGAKLADENVGIEVRPAGLGGDQREENQQR